MSTKLRVLLYHNNAETARKYVRGFHNYCNDQKIPLDMEFTYWKQKYSIETHKLQAHACIIEQVKQVDIIVFTYNYTRPATPNMKAVKRFAKHYGVPAMRIDAFAEQYFPYYHKYFIDRLKANKLRDKLGLDDKVNI